LRQQPFQRFAEDLRPSGRAEDVAVGIDRSEPWRMTLKVTINEVRARI